jgi:hypothetical protein
VCCCGESKAAFYIDGGNEVFILDVEAYFYAVGLKEAACICGLTALAPQFMFEVFMRL